MRKTVPIRHEGRVVGKAVVEDTPTGVRLVSSTIHDPKMLKILEDTRAPVSLYKPEKEK